MKKKRKIDPAKQAKREIAAALNPMRSELQSHGVNPGQPSRFKELYKEAEAIAKNTPGFPSKDRLLIDDEPTVIGTDPKIKFARLREKARQNEALNRYIAILNKYGEDSKQDKKFILKLIQHGDGDVLGLCNVARAQRALAREEDGKKCKYPHGPSEVCVICRPRPKKSKKPSK